MRSPRGADLRNPRGSLLTRPLVLVAAFLGLIVVLLAVAQLVLPGIAAQRLRDQLSHSGTVEKVEVHAFPAIELLWHHADRVVIRMRSYRSTPTRLSSRLGGVSDTGSLQASADQLQTGLVTLRNATLIKRGDQLRAAATVTESDLRSAFPVLDSVQPVASSAGQLIFQGTATVFGVTATADATLEPRDGALVVTPDVPLGGLATITVFDSPVIAVDAVTASPIPGGFVLRGQARLR